MAKSKGVGGAGCCCGGCWSPPFDGRGASTSSITKPQQYCCRCIPDYVCVSVSSIGSYDSSSSVLIPRFCGSVIPGESPYKGDAIQFRGTVYWGDEAVAINIRLAIVYEQCFLFWEVPEKSESGYRLIDPNEPVSSYECGAGQRTESCKNFGGTWEIDEGLSLVISAPQTLDISENIKCGGCKCMCKCLCMSVYSRSSTGDFTLFGSNEVVCAEISEDQLLNCAEDHSEIVRTASWEMDGWKVSLTGGDDAPFDSRTVNAGIERTLACDLQKVLRFVDGEQHVIDFGESCGGTSTWQVQDVDAALAWVMISDDCFGAGVPVPPASDPSEAGIEETTECGCVGDSGIDVQYESQFSSEGVPLSFRWVGRSVGESSQIEFMLWNWNEAEWETIGFEDGRPSDIEINSYFGRDIDQQYIGTAENLNKVRLRLVCHYGESLFTDMLRVRTTRCCRIKLQPKDGVVPKTPLPDFDMSQHGNCPDVFAFWNFFDESDTEWFVSIECSWCNGRCGSVTTTCCPRPIARTIFAEVEIDCPTCPNPFVVVLRNTTANLWDGVGVHCGQPFPMTVSCSGPGSWSASGSGAGACSFAGELVSVDCEPLNIVFEGDFQGGIGCCGVGSMTTSTFMRITIFE